MPLRLTRTQLNELVNHAREGIPNEVCGLLAGRGEEVHQVLRMTNTEPSPVSYYMDSGEQFRAQRWMREQGLAMVGIYHSHPASPAAPSSTDIRLAFYDDVTYVIVGMIGSEAEVRAYRIEEGRVRPEKIDVV